jgi:hypothetical protein
MTKEFVVKKDISLSPSALNLFRDCARCFWLEKIKGIKRPRGIFPSLPAGMDRVIKNYFDGFRKKGSLPPEFMVDGFKNTQLYSNQSQLDLWREWRTGPRLEESDGTSLFGAIDDLMVQDGKFIPFDYKTKGSPTTQEDAQRYYQNQIDCYALLLERSGLPQAGHGYLLYYSPKEVSEKGWVNFKLQAIRLETKTDRALNTFRAAVELLRGDLPAQAGNCEYCNWIKQFEPARNLGRP